MVTVLQSALSMISIEGSILTCGSGLVLARDCIAAHIVKVPDLVQLATRAAEIHLRAVHLRQRSLDLLEGVRLGVRRGDSRGSESLDLSAQTLNTITDQLET